MKVKLKTESLMELVEGRVIIGEKFKNSEKMVDLMENMLIILKME